MFERFTERSRQIVVLAQEEARLRHHGYIGVEHLLVATLREEEGLGARTLQALGLTVSQAQELLDPEQPKPADTPSQQIPFTTSARRVLENALREALSLGHNYIGTEHILLALTRHHDQAITEALAAHGITEDKVRNEVMRLLRGNPKPKPDQQQSVRPDIKMSPVLARIADALERIAVAVETNASSQEQSS